MSRDTGRLGRAAAELSRLLEAAAHVATPTDPVATQELDELRRLASALRPLPVDGIRPEFRAALRARLLDESRTLATAPGANRPLVSTTTVGRSTRTSPTPAFVRAARGPGGVLAPLARRRVRLSFGPATVRGPR